MSGEESSPVQVMVNRVEIAGKVQVLLAAQSDGWKSHETSGVLVAQVLVEAKHGRVTISPSHILGVMKTLSIKGSS